MKFLFILNDGPYGSERSYNALRLAGSLSKRDVVEVKVFLIGDAVTCGQTGQVTPNGYYNMERMVKAVLARGGRVGLCGSCCDARGIKEDIITQGAHRSSMEELADWTLEADNVLVF
ncbi:MAG: DsrE family protein [Armatimonadota bacterium]|nr:DsrE family protein [Armatimonadota bacterium]